jgi:hypothetical protein
LRAYRSVFFLATCRRNMIGIYKICNKNNNSENSAEEKKFSFSLTKIFQFSPLSFSYLFVWIQTLTHRDIGSRFNSTLQARFDENFTRIARKTPRQVSIKCQKWKKLFWVEKLLWRFDGGWMCFTLEVHLISSRP